jgi:hypothetical protein
VSRAIGWAENHQRSPLFEAARLGLMHLPSPSPAATAAPRDESRRGEEPHPVRVDHRSGKIGAEGKPACGGPRGRVTAQGWGGSD